MWHMTEISDFGVFLRKTFSKNKGFALCFFPFLSEIDFFRICAWCVPDGCTYFQLFSDTFQYHMLLQSVYSMCGHQAHFYVGFGKKTRFFFAKVMQKFLTSQNVPYECRTIKKKIFPSVARYVVRCKTTPTKKMETTTTTTTTTTKVTQQMFLVF